jgi:hypothetical protein
MALWKLHDSVLTPSIPSTAPAQDSVSYIREYFPNAFTDFTHLMGKPGPELDANWDKMYDLPSRIPKWQADLLE